MMARHASETPRSVSLDINVKLADGVVPVRRHPPAVYAFARSGQLIDKTATDASGHVQLRLPDLRVMQEVRVMVGPDTQADQSTVNELSRRGAKEQFVGKFYDVPHKFTKEMQDDAFAFLDKHLK